MLKKRIFVVHYVFLLGMSAFAQSADSQITVPEISLIQSTYPTRCYSVQSETLDVHPDYNVLPIGRISLKTGIKCNNKKPSVVVMPSPRNLTAPNFTTPHLPTMNLWQAIGKIGIGLTRGLAFDSYYSDYTLDD